MTDEMNIGAMLAEQIDRLLAGTVSRDLFIAVESGNPAAQLWRALEELGITTALVSEEQGGAGLAWGDTEPSLRAAGSRGMPVPLAETMLAAWALARAGLAIPSGPIAVSTALYELDNDGAISGSDAEVSWIESCDHLVAVAQRGSEQHLCLLDVNAITAEPLLTVAREPCSSIVVDALPPLASAKLQTPFSELGLRAHLAAIRAVQIGGAMEQLLELCVEYGNTREQFGRPIGKFQAIQHAIAELASHTAAAQVAGQYAFRQIDAGNGDYGATVAKIRVGQAATRGAEIAHQVFGAIGFTDEHILHYFTRRLWQWRSDAGSELWWAERFGGQLIAAGGDALWPSIAR